MVNHFVCMESENPEGVHHFCRTELMQHFADIADQYDKMLDELQELPANSVAEPVRKEIAKAESGDILFTFPMYFSFASQLFLVLELRSIVVLPELAEQERDKGDTTSVTLAPGKTAKVTSKQSFD